MTAKPDLLPLRDWMECLGEINAEDIRDYARANVAHAIAAKDAEIEALRAEVERLRAIAGCAYQMAVVHDAPEVWLDRLSQAANGDALPDPDTISDELLPYQPDAVCEAEARAERLAEALRLALNSHGKTLLTDPPQDAWKVNRVEEIGRALLRDQENNDA